MYKKFIKRFLDLILSLMALIILMPLMLIIYILVRVKLGKPAIFKQERPGKDEKIFTLYKFRTMTDEKDENGNLLPDEQRLTKFGKILSCGLNQDVFEFTVCHIPSPLRPR